MRIKSDNFKTAVEDIEKTWNQFDPNHPLQFTFLKKNVASLYKSEWAMYKWLQNFAYRVNISLWVFLLAGSITIMFARLTISYQAIKIGHNKSRKDA